MIRTIGQIEGREVREATLTSQTGMVLRIMDWGAVVRDWRVPVGGEMRPVVLGFDDPALYPAHSPHFGAIAGRVANRIAKGRFTLDGRTYTLPVNNGPNHLHGGPRGFGRRFWDIEADERSARLTLVSPDGDAGYPGTLRVAVTYTLTGNRAEIAFDAETDAATPVNLVQHHYFNLMGGGDVLDHRLMVNATATSEVDADLTPSGRLLPVAGTPFDFRDPRPFRDAGGAPVAVDHNFALAEGRDPAAPAAVLEAPDGSLSLRLWTDQPGIQVYNAARLALDVPGLDGRRYPAFAGVCLEDQGFPDAVNHPHFPSVILRPGTRHAHRCTIEIG